MEFAAHFKYDREFTPWLSGFIGRALPGTCLPEEVAFDLGPCDPALDARACRLFTTLDVEGGQVDIAVNMAVRDFDSLVGAGPRFEDPEITWDVLDADGAHLRTLVWSDPEGRWLEIEDPLAGICGIPLECDRVYVEVECSSQGLRERADIPLRLIWPDGRSFPIRSTARHVEHGRAAFGNLVERFDVFIGKSDEVRTVWHQDGRWFMRKPGASRAKRR